MNVEEFKAWLSRNVGKGGKRPHLDEFNKSMKGSERNPRAPEYPCKDVEEYPRYKAYEDLRSEEEKKKQEEDAKRQDNSRNANTAQGAGRAAQSIARAIVPKVALVVVGSVVVVTSYNEIKAHEAAAAVTTTTWTWAEDYSSATLSFLNRDGKTVRELPGEITSETLVAATCTLGGKLLYTATVSYASTTYTDSRTAHLDPLGHLFGEGTKGFDENGNPIIDYECGRCHEHFIVTISPEEFDPDKPEYDAQWTWSDDHSTCEVELFDKNGKSVKKVEAEVVTSDIHEATCTEAGSKHFKASLVEGWYTYEDSVEETLPALGHSFGEGEDTIIDGKPAKIYTCSRCLEQFTITLDPTEQALSLLGINPYHIHLHHHAF